MPTFDDMNELTMSGTLPERSAAKILSSLIPPTTLTSTSGCFWSYSATTFLNSVSSWPALQPTQIVIVVACFAAAPDGLLDAGPNRDGDDARGDQREQDDPRGHAFHPILPVGVQALVKFPNERIL